MVTEIPEPEFYIVWSPEGVKPPRHKHADQGAAEAEAVRLARLHPGATFHVLAHMGTAKKVDVTITRVSNIPF